MEPMHEFSLCQNLLREARITAQAIALQNTAVKPAAKNTTDAINTQSDQLVITAITVRMGLFSGIDKHLLRRAFDVAVADHHRYWPTHSKDHRPLAEYCQPLGEHASAPASLSMQIQLSPQAQLIVEDAGATVYCEQCHRQFIVDGNNFRRHYLNCPHNSEHPTRLLSGNELLITNIQYQLQQTSPLPFSPGRRDKNPEGSSHV